MKAGALLWSALVVALGCSGSPSSNAGSAPTPPEPTEPAQVAPDAPEPSATTPTLVAPELVGVDRPGAPPADQVHRRLLLLARAAQNAEASERVHAYLDGWMAVRDEATGLIPRALDGANGVEPSPYWNAKDAAADNYAFMVLSGWFTDGAMFRGPLVDMLETERRLTRSPTGLPFDYSFTDGQQLEPATRLDAHLGAAEYLKDGIIPIVELLGTDEPWMERGQELLDAIWENADYETPFGLVPGMMPLETGTEVNGDLLQAMSRLYWANGRDERLLELACRLADVHLLPGGGGRPDKDFWRLVLRDHGSEVVTGLSEFYATLHFAGQEPGGERWAQKKAEYQPILHAVLDRLLEVGRNEHGMFYSAIDPNTGEVRSAALADTFGYLLDAYYTVWLIDGVERYREAVLQPLAALETEYPDEWPDNGDSYADAAEGALNLLLELGDEDSAPSVARWVDEMVQAMWLRQRNDGTIDGWHADGNFARTSIMYALWKSAGVRAEPYAPGLGIGAEITGDSVSVVVTSPRPWSGRLIFDRARHTDSLGMPLDWPRVNRFPEWFPVAEGEHYSVIGAGSARVVDGRELLQGIEVSVPGGGETSLRIEGVER